MTLLMCKIVRIYLEMCICIYVCQMHKKAFADLVCSIALRKVQKPVQV